MDVHRIPYTEKINFTCLTSYFFSVSRNTWPIYDLEIKVKIINKPTKISKKKLQTTGNEV